jgi:Cu-Zn family superoxide dismutase
MRVRLLLLLATALLPAGCGNQSTPSSDALAPSSMPAGSGIAAATSAPPGGAGPDHASVQRLPKGTALGTFLPYEAGSTAITYDTAVVPPGATARVTIARSGNGVTVRLAATGLIPMRAYGAHLHTKPCSEAADAAGSHYQHDADPSMPSVDPSYANPGNEVWLDFTADATGAAAAKSAEPWTFDEMRPPRSLILHAQVTRTEKGVAGTAGPRVACLTLPPT